MKNPAVALQLPSVDVMVIKCHKCPPGNPRHKRAQPTFLSFFTYLPHYSYLFITTPYYSYIFPYLLHVISYVKMCQVLSTETCARNCRPCTAQVGHSNGSMLFLPLAHKDKTRSGLRNISKVLWKPCPSPTLWRQNLPVPRNATKQNIPEKRRKIFIIIQYSEQRSVMICHHNRMNNQENLQKS